jgi:translation initiation factor IF-1
MPLETYASPSGGSEEVNCNDQNTHKAKIAQRAKKVKVHFKPLLVMLLS